MATAVPEERPPQDICPRCGDGLLLLIRHSGGWYACGACGYKEKEGQSAKEPRVEAEGK